MSAKCSCDANDTKSTSQREEVSSYEEQVSHCNNPMLKIDEACSGWRGTQAYIYDTC